jgi:hypothetical protein
MRALTLACRLFLVRFAHFVALPGALLLKFANATHFRSRWLIVTSLLNAKGTTLSFTMSVRLQIGVLLFVVAVVGDIKGCSRYPFTHAASGDRRWF